MFKNKNITPPPQFQILLSCVSYSEDSYRLLGRTPQACKPVVAPPSDRRRNPETVTETSIYWTGES